MIRSLTAGSALAFLIACGDGQMLANDARSVNERFGIEDPEGTASELTEDDIPPGTEDPESSRSISRREARDESGGGLVESVRYDADDDTFFVDGLAFDGENVYTRAGAAAAIEAGSGYLVFAADETTPDDLTGNPIGQIVPYRAIHGRSTVLVDGEPRTVFAIVRTGGYADFGFGGFVYSREGGVAIPTTGQATFAGDYVGVRVAANSPDPMFYVTGDMTLDIDFDDFNANDGIKGIISGREIFAMDGSSVTLEPEDTSPILFVVEEGRQTLTDAGEIVVQVKSFKLTDEGALEDYFVGEFTGIMAGDARDAADGGEIVGVMTAVAEREDDSLVQETGGVILSR